MSLRMQTKRKLDTEKHNVTGNETTTFDESELQKRKDQQNCTRKLKYLKTTVKVNHIEENLLVDTR